MNQQAAESLPDVFAYVDYRLFLDDRYRALKAQNPKFSHRFISTQVQAGSTGWFSDIVRGRTNLSGVHLERLCKVFRVEGASADYFETLVRYDQSGSIEEKQKLYRKLIAIKGVKPELVGKDRFEFYSAWYHAAIRELLFFHDFKGSYADLGRKMNPPVGAAEARKSVQLLLSLGFIEKRAGDCYRPTTATLKKDPAFKSLHLESFLKTNIQLGAQSLESVPKEERDISAMTLSLSSAGFAKAKEEIRSLRNRLLALAEEDSSPERVYQCNFHMFPVTR